MCGHFEPMSTPSPGKTRVSTPPREPRLRPAPDQHATAHERSTPVGQQH